VCSNSTLIESIPFVENGLISPYFSAVGDESSATDCSLISVNTRGLWYSLQGDGCSYTASTEGSAFDTVLAVYFTLSDGCEQLYCLAENDDTNLETTSEISWSTTADLSYYILVAGIREETGDFMLNVMVRHCIVICLFFWLSYLMFVSVLLLFFTTLESILSNVMSVCYSNTRL